jgi:hypothetical protein
MAAPCSEHCALPRLSGASSVCVGSGELVRSVVNLWMPFQALRDCLPVGHPVRRNVLYLQMTFIFSLYVLLPAAVAASVQAAIVGKVIFVVLAFLCLSLGFNAYRMVTAIAADHRSALCAIG